MFENPRRGRQERNFTTNVPKILDLNLKSSSKQIFSKNWRWVPLLHGYSGSKSLRGNSIKQRPWSYVSLPRFSDNNKQNKMYSRVTYCDILAFSLLSYRLGRNTKLLKEKECLCLERNGQRVKKINNTRGLNVIRGVSRGARPHPLIFRSNWVPKGRKKILEIAPPLESSKYP